MIDDGLPDFTGKLVLIYVADAPRAIDTGLLLEYASFKRMDSRLFVVGRASAVAGTEWVSQLPAVVAWDAVVHYLIFDSPEDYLARMKKSEPSWWLKIFRQRGGV